MRLRSGLRGARADVVVNDIDERSAYECARAIAVGGRAVHVAGSVASWSVAAAMVEAALRRSGRIDGLLSNATADVTGRAIRFDGTTLSRYEPETLTVLAESPGLDRAEAIARILTQPDS